MMWWLLLAIPTIPLIALVTLWIIGERGHLLLPSTRAVLRRNGGSGGGNGSSTGRGSLLNALHGYVYGPSPASGAPHAAITAMRTAETRLEVTNLRSINTAHPSD